MKKLRERLAVQLSLPKEIALNLPLVTIIGQGEMVIENYKNLAEFSETQVRVRTNDSIITVQGAGLTLQQITSENLLISGRISGIMYE